MEPLSCAGSGWVGVRLLGSLSLSKRTIDGIMTAEPSWRSNLSCEQSSNGLLSGCPHAKHRSRWHIGHFGLGHVMFVTAKI